MFEPQNSTDTTELLDAPELVMREDEPEAVVPAVKVEVLDPMLGLSVPKFERGVTETKPMPGKLGGNFKALFALIKRR